MLISRTSLVHFVHSSSGFCLQIYFQETRIRLLLLDLFFSLYGMSAPFVKGGPAIISGHQRAKRRQCDGGSNTLGWHNEVLDGEQPPSPESRSFNEDIDMLQ